MPSRTTATPSLIFAVFHVRVFKEMFRKVTTIHRFFMHLNRCAALTAIVISMKTAYLGAIVGWWT